MYMTTLCKIHCFYAVKWKPVEMFDLLKVLQPLSADWEELAFNLIKKDRMTVTGHHQLIYVYVYIYIYIYIYICMYACIYMHTILEDVQHLSARLNIRQILTYCVFTNNILCFYCVFTFYHFVRLLIYVCVSAPSGLVIWCDIDHV